MSMEADKKRLDYSQVGGYTICMEKIFSSLQFDIYECGHMKHTAAIAAWNDPGVHRDPFCRIYLIVDGDGKIWIKDRYQRLSTGHLYLFPSNMPLRHIPSPGLDQYWIHFTATLPGGLSVFDWMNWRMDLKVTNIREDIRLMSKLLRQAESASEVLDRQAVIRSLAARFLGEPKPGWEDSMLGLRRFEKVLEHIERHIAEPISVPALAKMLSLHPNYFSNLFTEKFGMAPREYIVKKRVERAQTLLWCTSESLKEIAAQVGYDDVCYFCRIFKSLTGSTPSIYRKRRFKRDR